MTKVLIKKIKMDLAKLEGYRNALILHFCTESIKQGWSKEERKKVLIRCVDQSYDYNTVLSVLMPFLEDVTDDTFTNEKVEHLEHFDEYLENRRLEDQEFTEFAKRWESQGYKRPFFTRRSFFQPSNDKDDIPEGWFGD